MGNLSWADLRMSEFYTLIFLFYPAYPKTQNANVRPLGLDSGVNFGCKLHCFFHPGTATGASSACRGPRKAEN